MTPAIFVVVDAVILDGLVSAEDMAQWHHKYGTRERYWREVVTRGEAALGWWRSTWPSRT